MVDKITKRQYEEIEEAFTYGSIDDFHRILAEHTGISTVSYTGYQYFIGEDYVGDSNDFDLLDVLKNAYIEVVDDGK